MKSGRVIIASHAPLDRAAAVVVRLVNANPGPVEEDRPRISVIIPTLNEAGRLDGLLRQLCQYQGPNVEVIVVDGGSDDGTEAVARRHADVVLTSAPGRGLQMNLGAQHSSGDILLFLHADSRLPDRFTSLLTGDFWNSKHHWGRFDLRLSGGNAMFRIIERLINLRSRLTGIATGDQAIFVRRSLFLRAGGYPPLPLMEDIVLCRRLRQTSRPFCPSDEVVSSSRKWEREGILRTTLLMWYLRLAFWLGRDPGKLAEIYYRPR